MQHPGGMSSPPLGAGAAGSRPSIPVRCYVNNTIMKTQDRDKQNPGLLHGRHNLLSEPPGKPFAHKGTEEADKSQKDRKMKARTSKVSSGDWRVTCQTATLIRLICAFSFGLGTPSYFFRKKKRTTCRKGLSFRRERSYPYLVYSYPESVLKGTWGVPASSTG